MADYYKVLSVEKNADLDAIKKSYRKLALKYHPDRNKGDKKAEERFKEISEAYAVLSDPEKKHQYDAVGDSQFHRQYSRDDIFRGTDFSHVFGEFDLGGLEGIFGRIFGGAYAGEAGDGARGFRGGFRGGFGGAATKTPDSEAVLEIGFEEAFHGGERELTLRMSDGSKRTLKVRIPKGAKDAGRLRLSGMGAQASHGGPAGDLVLILRVHDHPRFDREGDDLATRVALRLSDALLGGSVDVVTLDGIKKVKIPSAVRPGTRIRLRGLGFPKAGRDARGDLYVVVDFDTPAHLSPEQRAAVEGLRSVGL